MTQYMKKLLIMLLICQILLALAVSSAAFDDNIIKSKIIEKRIEKGLYYLYENQQQGGDFPAYYSFSPDMSNRMELNNTIIYDTGIIFHTLNLAGNKHSKQIVYEMKNKSIGFLLDNRYQHGVWKFIGKNQTLDMHETVMVPDVDDTSLAFAGLVESGVNISDETLDYMLDFTSPEGIFKTYINSPEWMEQVDPNDPQYDFYEMNYIDDTINANVIYAYSLRDRTPTGVVQYLNKIAENRSFINGTLYYPSPYVFTYFVTKAYSDGKVTDLEPSLVNIRDYLLETQKSDRGWGNDVDTALATVALINIGYDGKPLEKAINHILEKQRIDGSWNIYSFFIAPSSPPMYYGSQELTTSLNLEALIKYKKTLEDKRDDHENKMAEDRKTMFRRFENIHFNGIHG